MKLLTEFRMIFILDLFDDYISPSELGRLYGQKYLGRDNCHSSTASPICKRLVAKGLVSRNNKGWYKLIKENQNG